MKNLAGLMKQAQEMQERMQEVQAKLEAMEIEGASGAGMARVVLNGKGEMRRVILDPKIVDPNDLEMLQDLIIAAHADAKRKAEAHSQSEMQKLTAGLPIPPGMKLPF